VSADDAARHPHYLIASFAYGGCRGVQFSIQRNHSILKKPILHLVGAGLIWATVLSAEQPKCFRQSSPHQKYTCVMHPDVVMDKPGKCPKCGMNLVPKQESELRKASRAGRPTPNAQRPMFNIHSSADHEHLRSPRSSAAREMPMMDPTSGANGAPGMSMQSSIDLTDPMSRESSGTSWLPDSTPMYGRMLMLGNDMLMLHGAIFPRYTNVSTRRGDDRIDAPNWVMAMFSHPLGENAQLGLRAMMSLDPLTEGGRGYPLLFQTGESWHDQALHDRQHPHDLFAELSASYSQKFGSDLSGYLYFGYPGEPALGPPTFMHRLSAMDNPDAPLGHHWQDSTHITFGVATVGAVWKNIKMEGSVFTGREPDENRYDFDRPRFDSFSGRISWNPTQNLALQVSHGYVKSPEALEAKVNQHRTIASIIYNQPLGEDANWSSSFVWGQNNTTGEGKSQSFLVETNYQWKRETIYVRLEYVEKSGHELALSDADLDRIFGIGGYTLGYVHDFLHRGGIDIGLGGQFTFNTRPGSLDRYYGDDLAYGFELFLRVRPSRLTMMTGSEKAEIQK
jgi:Heavy metal binding domain